MKFDNTQQLNTIMHAFTQNRSRALIEKSDLFDGVVPDSENFKDDDNSAWLIYPIQQLELNSTSP